MSIVGITAEQLATLGDILHRFLTSEEYVGFRSGELILDGCVPISEAERSLITDICGEY